MPKWYMEGYQSRRNGMSRSQCPYNKGIKRSEWIDGYNQAKEEQYYKMYGGYIKEMKRIEFEDKLFNRVCYLICFGGFITIIWFFFHSYLGII